MEFNFQKIVLIVAICLLIVVLTGMSYLMKKIRQKNQRYKEKA